jgi:hypothetical protein
MDLEEAGWMWTGFNWFRTELRERCEYGTEISPFLKYQEFTDGRVTSAL